MTEPKSELRPRYSLREGSKTTSRYREYIGGESQQKPYELHHHGHGKTSSSSTTIQQQQQFRIQRSQNTNMPSPSFLRRREQMRIQQVVVEADVPIGAEQEISTSENVQREQPKPVFGYASVVHSLPDRRLNINITGPGHELSIELKTNLRKLKNVLKLPKARRLVFCEFFYSGVDQQIFLAENEFSQLMHESFPNLKCVKLRKPEWREVRRLIGKPRRCSQAFLDEERTALEDKRQKIRDIYNGRCTSLSDEIATDLPSHLPRPPVLGQKIYARVHFPKDGIYAATVDAIAHDGYRVIFDEENIPATVIKDYEVMFDQPSELLAINYFIEQNKANSRGTSNKSTTQLGHYLPTSYTHTMAAPNGKFPTHLGPETEARSGQEAKKVTIAKDEKVGNFPVRMLVILVKLCKVIEYKKQLVGQLTLMNDCAAKMNLLGNEYPQEFKVQFAQFVLDLETVNRLFHNYLSALQTHYNTLLPHLSAPQPTDRPELLRKTCNTHAFQIVKHCNSELNVQNKRILHMITSLASILLQLHTIGMHKKRFTVSDTNLLSESLKQIRSQISPNNAAAFQDYVELHMKQMLQMMVKK